MLKIEDLGSRCTGCETCAAVCPHKSVQMVSNGEGFFFPAVDYNKCKGCRLCEKKCPALNIKGPEPSKQQSVYAVWSKNAAVRGESASGGAFSALAQGILRYEGTVFGAAFNAEMELLHAAAHNEYDLKKLRGSKYIQSHTEHAFREAKSLLAQGKRVLFCGTPCQIDGLYRALGDTEGLFTVDLLCHGVGSIGFFQRYIKYHEAKTKKRIADVRFRDKSNGWRVPTFVFSYRDGCETKQIFRNNLFLSLFYNDLILRRSCYHCRFARRARVGDISIGDYWGIEVQHPEIQATQEGVSLVMVNSEKGRQLFDEVKGSLEVRKSAVSKAVYGNRALERPCRRNMFRSVTLLFLNNVRFPLSGLVAHAFLFATRVLRKIRKVIQGDSYEKKKT